MKAILIITIATMFTTMVFAGTTVYEPDPMVTIFELNIEPETKLK